MLKEIPEIKQKLKYKFHCYNLFTNDHLSNYLWENGYGVIHTMRGNIIPTFCPLSNKSTLTKRFKRRDYCSKLDKKITCYS